MKTFFTLILTLFTLFCIGQNRFENGYIIYNDNERIECLIKNEGWNSNPTNFLYKLNENDKVNEGSLNQIKEFGVGEEFKFQRFRLNIDRSPNNLQFMSSTKDPIFVEEVIYLKLLVEGSANLYYYQDSNLRRFFYSINGTKPEQLVYKKYKERQKIKTNESYRAQILANLKCNDMDIGVIRNLDYYRGKLTAIFNLYNICETGTSNILKKKNKGKLDLWGRLGFLSSNVDFNYNPGVASAENVSENLGNSSSVYIGFELEYTLPFNNKKWSIYFSPSYQAYSKNKTFTRFGSAASQTEEVDYTYIDILLGVRHYFYLNTKSMLFVNAGYVVPIDLNDSNISEREINSTGSISFGVGYNFNRKLNAEVRYNTGRDLLDSFDFRTISTDFSSLGLILGYNFL